MSDNEQTNAPSGATADADSWFEPIMKKQRDIACGTPAPSHDTVTLIGFISNSIKRFYRRARKAIRMRDDSDDTRDDSINAGSLFASQLPQDVDPSTRAVLSAVVDISRRGESEYVERLRDCFDHLSLRTALQQLEHDSNRTGTDVNAHTDNKLRTGRTKAAIVLDYVTEKSLPDFRSFRDGLCDERFTVRRRQIIDMRTRSENLYLITSVLGFGYTAILSIIKWRAM